MNLQKIAVGTLIANKNIGIYKTGAAVISHQGKRRCNG
jgi:hypothetical protein